MHSLINLCSRTWTARFACLLALVVTLLATAPVLADIGTLGDVYSENVFDPGPPETPVNPDGYELSTDTTGELIIGDEFIGGLTMDVALQPFPLRSTMATIGNNDGVIGRATFTGIPSDWLIETDLIIGNEGQGFLDLFNSALVQVGDPDYMTMTDVVAGVGITTLGMEETGYGELTINGVASRLATAELIVGELGYGRIDVNQRGALFTGDSIIGNDDGSIGLVNVTDSGSRWTVGDSTTTSTLTIGNGAAITSTGQGTLNIANQALVQVSGDTFINRDGRVNLSTGGRLRSLPSFGNVIALNGVLSGDGFVDGPVVILGNGQVRNAASIANTREKLVFSGPVVNGGTIEILGGEMDFNDSVLPLINNFEVVVRDGIMRFPAGMINTGVVAIGGNSTLHGDITGTGSLQVLSDSESLIIGDLTFSTSSIVGLSVGSAPGTLDVTGSIDLASSLLSLDYSAGISSQIGDTYQILQSPGGILGTFANPASQVSADGRLWDINYAANIVTVTATGAVALPFGADFNGDGIVNQLDLIIWQNNYGRTSPPNLAAFGDADGDGDVDGRDFLEIQNKFGGPPLVAALANVPEPSSLVLMLGAVLGFGWRRKAE